jgi:hypothetical protein
MNSIYDYYQKNSDGFYVARVFESKDGQKAVHHFQNPLARAVKIPDFEEFDFFTFQEKKQYVLCEGLSGAVIISQRELPERRQRRCNKKEFCEIASKIIKQRGGVSEINVLIVNFLCDHEQVISPRYKAIKV